MGLAVHAARAEVRRAFHSEVFCGLQENRFGWHVLRITESRISSGGVWIDHLNGIVVNRNARIGEGVRIYHQVTIGADFDHGPGEAPVIGDRTRIGAGAKIIGNIRVGSNVTIGANAVVTKDVPDNATVVGANVIID